MSCVTPPFTPAAQGTAADCSVSTVRLSFVIRWGASILTSLVHRSELPNGLITLLAPHSRYGGKILQVRLGSFYDSKKGQLGCS